MLSRWSSWKLTVPRLGALLLLAVTTSPLSAANPCNQAQCLEQCRSSLAAVEERLSYQPAVASGWRKFLQLDDLAKQLDMGPAADPAMVEHLCGRFVDQAAQLDQVEFAELNTSVTNWHKYLQTTPLSSQWELARQQAVSFQDTTNDDVARAWQAASSHLHQLNQILVSEGTAGHSWRAWLLWEQVQTALAKKNPALISPERHSLWQESHLALNLPELAAADDHLTRWQHLHQCRLQKETSATFLKRIDDLQQAYNAWQAKPTADRLAPVVQGVCELESRGQAVELTTVLRRLHSQPNLVLRASKSFIQRETRTAIANAFPINDTIAGAQVYGRGSIEGEAILQLIPTERLASLEVLLNANVRSRTSSTTSGVQVNTRGTTEVSARKSLTVSGLGVQTSTTKTTAISQIQLENLNADGPVRQRIALQQYEDTQGTAKQESEAKTALRVSTQLDQQVAQLQQQLTSSQANRFLAPLVSYRPSLPRWWRTTDQQIEGRFWAAGPNHFAATSAAPTVPLQGGFAVQLHETFVERSLGKELGGKTIRGSQLQDKLTGFFGDEEKVQTTVAEADEDEKDWNLHFAERPVGIEFQDQMARITFFCTGFTSEKGEFPGLKVTSAYRVTCLPPYMVLKRCEILVLPLEYSEENPVRLSGRQQLLRRMVERMFEQQMPPTITLDPLRPAADSRLKTPLDFVIGQADGGWMSLVLEPAAGKTP